MAHSQVPLGVLPAGTANVLAMEMKLGGDFLRAARGCANAARNVSRSGK